MADVQAVVNVDTDAARAAQLAASWGLPTVAIRDMDSPGIWQLPAVQKPYGGAATGTFFRADPHGPLWAVAVAGIYDAPKEAGGSAPTVPMQLTLLGGAQSSSATAIQAGMAGFDEHQATYDRLHHEMPIVVVVAEPDSLTDCLWFWNARAMRSHRHVDMPLLLFPDEAPKHWLNFAQDIRRAQIHSDLSVQPDVVLMSRSLSDEALHDAAHRAELVPADTDSELSWIADRNGVGEPLTYRVDNDFEPELFRRRWGRVRQNSFHQFVGPSRFDVDLPVAARSPAAALLRLRGEPFDRLPRKDVVARMITEQGNYPSRLPASWHDDQIQIPVPIPWLDWPRLTLSVPRPQGVVPRLLTKVTRHFEPSTPGTIGVSVSERADIGALREVLVVEALTALKTERTEHFLKVLHDRYPDWLPTDQTKELAAEFGGRQARKFRSATNTLAGWNVTDVTPALEIACVQGWAERGLGLDCAQCRLHSFVPLRSANGAAMCPACSAPAWYQRENRDKAVEIVYRLNGFIDRAIDNGVLGHLLVVATLQGRAPDTHLLPGVDVVFEEGSKSEVDVLGIHEGRVVAGEVKLKADEFRKGGQIERDIALSKRLDADVHLMAATDVIDETLQSEARGRCQEAGLELLILHEPDLRPGLADLRKARELEKQARERGKTGKAPRQRRRREPTGPSAEAGDVPQPKS